MTFPRHIGPIPKPGARKGKKDPWASTRDKLDRVFSKYIRTIGTVNGVGRCISCGQLKPYEQLDCGHFIGRQYFGTRWSDVNCQTQCRFCNRFNEGEKDKFAAALIKKYGADVIDRLLVQKKLHARKPDIFTMGFMIKEYEAKLNDRR